MTVLFSYLYFLFFTVLHTIFMQNYFMHGECVSKRRTIPSYIVLIMHTRVKLLTPLENITIYNIIPRLLLEPFGLHLSI